LGLPNGFAVAVVITVLLAGLFGGATVAGRQIAQLLEQLPRHEANLRDKGRFLHFEFGTPGIWQRAAATLRSVGQEISDPKDNGRPLQVQVAQDTGPPLFLMFEFTRKSVPSLLTGALALLLTVFVLLQYVRCGCWAPRRSGARPRPSTRRAPISPITSSCRRA
jgi:predicted PurR-regulated permease PerM